MGMDLIEDMGKWFIHWKTINSAKRKSLIKVAWTLMQATPKALTSLKYSKEFVQIRQNWSEMTTFAGGRIKMSGQILLMAPLVLHAVRSNPRRPQMAKLSIDGLPEELHLSGLGPMMHDTPYQSQYGEFLQAYDALVNAKVKNHDPQSWIKYYEMNAGKYTYFKIDYNVNSLDWEIITDDPAKIKNKNNNNSNVISS
jgi:hypothetical protein